MRFFNNVNTIEELKKEYRRLAFKFHPDRGGDAETMKIINAEYDIVFAKLQKTSADKADHNAKVDEFKEIIDKIISFNVDIEICGCWIWVGGNTKPYKDQLKEAGFYWASKKTMWYWRPEESKHKGKSNMTIDDIRNKYGSEKVNNSYRIRPTLA